NVIEEVDGSGSLIAHYTQSMSIDELLAETRSGSSAYYEQDGLGSVTSLTDSTGAILASYTYDAFGNMTASTGSFVNSYRYTNRELDAETGLYNYRARYFDVTSGRFLNEDPTGFGTGLNFYRYVSNNPVALHDPTGLCPEGDNALDLCHAQLSAR